ncbi:atlastin-2 [Parasteatoda tepidariorum]|uniref:atlastin-2 n=1 Tax=Parasteatoda tepidariorum TaxID=114398 RepID=UPI00077FB46C|nr:atlastin-2 [Parasteatoda tepidariorum]XP_015926747.1 atlastin-2 [Parasteatoda tepidariorum]XP_015926748.1 atlastin-2 [Parasteatoda tepidariorum]XP_015926749.1 atlastin-2 [Parasteatoda tepidariorum]
MNQERGEAITIVSAEDHSFELIEENLRNVLLNNDIKDRKIVVVSVAGAFRKGKSFLLNFMLRFLESQGASDWLGNEDEPLKGFSWRGGSERDTTGILVWSKVFPLKLESGEEVAVLLMDTQGSFDSSSTVKECATVFALSTMLSSIQVYNLSQNIHEYDLQHLELFTEYGRLAMEGCDEKPFQKLVFLVRDWSFPYEAEYGAVGGQMLLDRRLEISEKQHPQLQQLRKHIRSCFSDVGCFLMPHPGLEVASSPNFDGRLSVIRSEFKESLQDLVSLLLSPSNLLPKQIAGRDVTCKDLINYFKAYVEIFKGGELPEPKSMLNATAEANNLSAAANSKEYYSAEMEKICGGDRPFVSHQILERKHFEIRQIALQKFSETKKMGNEELEHSFKEKLVKEIDEMYSSLVRFNDGKQIAHAVRTPATLLLIIVICYLNSTLLRALGLEAFAVSINFFMVLTIVALGLWGYCRFTGEAHHVGTFIDNMVNIVLTNFIFPSQKQIAQAFAGKGNFTTSMDGSIETLETPSVIHTNLLHRNVK